MSNARAPRKPIPPKKRVRLIQVTVTAVIFIDDGETLQPFDQQPIVLSPAEWENDYSNKRWPREIAAFEEQLNAGGEA